MTETDYILVSDVARIQAAASILRQVIPSERVPEADYRQVMGAIARWEEATFRAIETARNQRTKETPPVRLRPRTCGEGNLCLCHEEKERES